MAESMFQKEATVEVTKENAPFAPEEQLGKYTLKRWTWYEKQDAIDRSTIVIDEERGILQTPIKDYYAEMLRVTVRGHPETVNWNIDFIKGDMDPDVGDLLRDASRGINGLTEAEKKRFLERSASEDDTPT